VSARRPGLRAGRGRVAALGALGLTAHASGACLRPAEERARLDQRVGVAVQDGVRVEVEDGLASVRALDAERLTLWAQAPVLSLQLETDIEQPRPFTLELMNARRDTRLETEAGSTPCTPLPDRASGCSFELVLAGSTSLRLASPDADDQDSFVFAVLGDVQRAIGSVDEVFARMNEDPELAFVVSPGDLVNTGARDELTRFQDELAILQVPYFSTVGNHELGGTPDAWHELFGRFNVHFHYKGVTFSLLDAGNATLDPIVYDWLAAWLEAARDATHTVYMHIPPLDPVGVRGGGFRSRKEAAKLMQMLGEARVDALFLGHIHSYYTFSAAGVPSYISGGGGAIPERFDGIGRHYLRVRASAARGIEDVAVVRID
jgi:3',5'-cyclic-AMP phosphodiesterase